MVVLLLAMFIQNIQENLKIVRSSSQKERLMGLGGVSIRSGHATKPAMVKMNTALVQAYDRKYVVAGHF